MHTILRFIASAAALYITVYLWHTLFSPTGLYLDPGVKGLEGCAIAALFLGIVNALIRPVLELIALPITCLTLGLFSIVINAVLFWLVGQFTPGFHVRGVLASLFGTIVMGFVGAMLSWLLVPNDKKPKATT